MYLFLRVAAKFEPIAFFFCPGRMSVAKKKKKSLKFRSNTKKRIHKTSGQFTRGVQFISRYSPEIRVLTLYHRKPYKVNLMLPMRARARYYDHCQSRTQSLLKLLTAQGSGYEIGSLREGKGRMLPVYL